MMDAETDLERLWREYQQALQQKRLSDALRNAEGDKE